MKIKSIVLTIAVLAALSAVAYFTTRPTPPPVADARVGQPLVDRTVVEQAAKLRLTDQGKTVTLVRQPDASWKVATSHDFPADFSKLATFLRRNLMKILTTPSPPTSTH